MWRSKLVACVRSPKVKEEEPLQDASRKPGLSRFFKSAVKALRSPKLTSAAEKRQLLAHATTEFVVPGSSATKAPTSFLDLPGELRNLIYGYITDSLLEPRIQYWYSPPPPPPALTRVNRQLRSEYLPICYRGIDRLTVLQSSRCERVYAQMCSIDRLTLQCSGSERVYAQMSVFLDTFGMWLMPWITDIYVEGHAMACKLTLKGADPVVWVYCRACDRQKIENKILKKVDKILTQGTPGLKDQSQIFTVGSAQGILSVTFRKRLAPKFAKQRLWVAKRRLPKHKARTEDDGPPWHPCSRHFF